MTVAAVDAGLAAQPWQGTDTPPDRSLVARISQARLGAGTRRWIAASLHSDDAVTALVRGEAVDLDLAAPSVPEPGTVQQCMLGRVAVTGFRGIGPTAVLDLAPEPGLTVVVGRNGSGKSSFAEAIEAALTGRNRRWEAMPSAWRDGWRNLHVDDRTEVAVDVHGLGRSEAVTVIRRWTGTSVRSAHGEVRLGSGETTSLPALGWRDDLQRYRPFLSYDELGRAVSGRSAELFDALTELLGLSDLHTAERRLSRACDKLAKRVERPARDREYLLEQLRGCDDSRARRAGDLLRAERPDLDRLASLAADDAPADPGEQRLLRRLRRLSVPERSLMSDVSSELRGAAMELEVSSDSKGAQARGQIGLLRAALDHIDPPSRSADCPVCRGHGTLGPDWAERARAEIARLEPVAAGVAAAHDRVTRAREQARFLMAPRPSWLPEGSELGRIWEEWAAGARLEQPGEIAAHIDEVGPRLRSAASAARKHATAQLEGGGEGWPQHAEQLTAWLEDAAEAEFAGELLAPAQRALEWFSEAIRDIRQERLRPLAAHTEHVWRQLRQERRIDMEAMRLVGRGAQRRLDVDVRVDGLDERGASGGGHAPGLLSQGEFQALALSICLPRTQLAGNPFGFLVLDDPVQAMDTQTVEGLATVLCEVAAYRQVLVFTHDTRLPDALAKLRLPARVCTIHRDVQSNVRLEDARFGTAAGGDV